MQPSLTSFIRKLEELFGVDLRSLGLLRVAIALVILLDLMQRSRDLVAHYTDFGVLPRAALIANDYTRWHLSIHLMNGTWEVQAVLFGIAAIFALLLLVGYQTRRATIVCWFFLLSVRNRNTLIWADALLSDVLFWGMFLPWGAWQSTLAADSWVFSPARFVALGPLATAVTVLKLRAYILEVEHTRVLRRAPVRRKGERTCESERRVSASVWVNLYARLTDRQQAVSDSQGAREALAIEIDTSLPAGRVIRMMEQSKSWRGLPKALRLDKVAASHQAAHPVEPQAFLNLQALFF